MGKLMYLKEESGYYFAPAIVKIMEQRKHGATAKIIFTNNDLSGWVYNKPWNVLSEDVRKPTMKELLRVPLKYYFKRKVKR